MGFIVISAGVAGCIAAADPPHKWVAGDIVYNGLSVGKFSSYYYIINYYPKSDTYVYTTVYQDTRIKGPYTALDGRIIEMDKTILEENDRQKVDHVSDSRVISGFPKV